MQIVVAADKWASLRHLGLGGMKKHSAVPFCFGDAVAVAAVADSDLYVVAVVASLHETSGGPFADDENEDTEFGTVDAVVVDDKYWYYEVEVAAAWALLADASLSEAAAVAV